MAAVAYNIVLNALTIREDLSDTIDIMTPADLPYHKLFEAETTDDVYKEWSVDQYAAPVTTAGAAEGADATYAKLAEPLRARAGVCIVTKTVKVSGTHREARQAGVSDIYNYLLEKEGIAAMKQMEINMRYMAGGTAKHAVEDTARPCSGLWWWLTEAFNGQVVVGMDYGSTDPFEPYKPAGLLTPTTPADITRLQFHDNIIEPAWNKGLEIDGSVMLVPSKVKRIISEFGLVYSAANGVQQRTIAAADKKLIETIDFFDTDFGTVGMLKDRYMSTTTSETWAGEAGVRRDATLLLVDPTKVTRLTYRGLHHKPLAPAGDHDRGEIIYEAGIKISNTLGAAIGINVAAD